MPAAHFEVLHVDGLVEAEDDADALDVLGGDGGVEGVDGERAAGPGASARSR
jgi:hypothetical protein